MVLNFGLIEILIILIIAYLFFGPKKLPKIGKKAGEAIKKISKGAEEFSKEINEVKELNELKEIKETVTNLSDNIKNI